MRLQSYPKQQLGSLQAVLEDRRFAELPVQPPEMLKIDNFVFYSICIRAFSPGQLAGECNSLGWAGRRKSREIECQGSVEGWMQAETEKFI